MFGQEFKLSVVLQSKGWFFLLFFMIIKPSSIVVIFAFFMLFFLWLVNILYAEFDIFTVLTKTLQKLFFFTLTHFQIRVVLIGIVLLLFLLVVEHNRNILDSVVFNVNWLTIGWKIYFGICLSFREWEVKLEWLRVATTVVRVILGLKESSSQVINGSLHASKLLIILIFSITVMIFTRFWFYSFRFSFFSRGCISSIIFLFRFLSFFGWFSWIQSSWVSFFLQLSSSIRLLFFQLIFILRSIFVTDFDRKHCSQKNHWKKSS